MEARGSLASAQTPFRVRTKCPEPIDHRRVPADQAITDPVDTLQVQLIIGLNWDKTHVLPLDGSAIASASMKSFLFEFTKGFTN